MKIITSEMVFKGHPDKICDQISDAILDACLEQDKNSRVAIETLIKNDLVVVAGELTTNAVIEIKNIIIKVLKSVHYDNIENYRFVIEVSKQSDDIALGVDKDGAGDQGIMYGYATDESFDLMPLSLSLSRRIAIKMDEISKDKPELFGSDGKCQVSVCFDEKDNPIIITTVVVSQQTKPGVERDTYEEIIKKECLLKVLPSELLDKNTQILINPTGEFVKGGAYADSGLTGRKIICDTYGGVGRHGGGAFCVDGDTEYLSPNGWIKIKDYIGGKVAQWDSGKLTFVYPKFYHESESKNMYHIKNVNALDMVLSENHDMVFETSKGNIVKKRVKDVLTLRDGFMNGFTGKIPTYFHYDGGVGVNLTDDEIRLQVAFSADGTIVSDYRGRIRVKKDYKKQRIRELLSTCRIEYKETSDNEFSIFYFIPPICNKHLYETMKNANFNQLRVIAEECVLWDGNRDNIYRTTIKKEADFIQFVFMAVYNTNVSISTEDRIGESFHDNYTRKSKSYSVYCNGCKTQGLKDGLCVTKFEPNDKKMFCFTVESGMLILRRNDRVFVTGNSGKDATKVDRSAAYYARYVAKNIVAAGVAKKCEVQVAYAIGVAKPVAINIDTFGTSKFSNETIKDVILKFFNFTPDAIKNEIINDDICYCDLAKYGHIGRTDIVVPWERTNKAYVLKKYFKEFK